MFMSRRRDKKEMNAYCFYTVGFIIAFMGFLYVKGIFCSNHQAWQNFLGETRHAFKSASNTL